MAQKRKARKSTAEMQEAFLKAYQQLKVVSRAAARVGILPARHRKWMFRCPEYRQRFLAVQRQMLKAAGKKSQKQLSGTVLKRENQRLFLSAFARCGQVAHAAGISAACHDTWMNDDAYAERFRLACEAVADFLQGRAWKRAVYGEPRYKFYRGEPIRWKNPETGRNEVFVERKYSDKLLMHLLEFVRRKSHPAGMQPEWAGQMAMQPMDQGFEPLTLEEWEGRRAQNASAVAGVPT